MFEVVFVFFGNRNLSNYCKEMRKKLKKRRKEGGDRDDKIYYSNTFINGFNI